MIRFVAFDLDGTLVDSHRDIADATNAVIADLGGTPLEGTPHEEVDGVVSTYVVQRTNGRMRDARDHACFRHETRASAWVGGAVRPQHFDCDVPVQPCISGPIHLTHAAGTDEILDQERPQPVAGLKRR